MMDPTVRHFEAVFAYMDDFRVGSPDMQTHFIHLAALFTALAANGLTINLEKCVFAILTLEILGHTILAAGSAPTAGHTDMIYSCTAPQDIKQMQLFFSIQ
jgi:hypothetical protein